MECAQKSLAEELYEAFVDNILPMDAEERRQTLFYWASSWYAFANYLYTLPFQKAGIIRRVFKKNRLSTKEIMHMPVNKSQEYSFLKYKSMNSQWLDSQLEDNGFLAKFKKAVLETELLTVLGAVELTSNLYYMVRVMEDFFDYSKTHSWMDINNSARKLARQVSYEPILFNLGEEYEKCFG